MTKGLDNLIYLGFGIGTKWVTGKPKALVISSSDETCKEYSLEIFPKPSISTVIFVHIFCKS